MCEQVLLPADILPCVHISKNQEVSSADSSAHGIGVRSQFVREVSQFFRNRGDHYKGALCYIKVCGCVYVHALFTQAVCIKLQKFPACFSD